jgi:hypothetical protein
MVFATGVATDVRSLLGGKEEDAAIERSKVAAAYDSDIFVLSFDFSATTILLLQHSISVT